MLNSLLTVFFSLSLLLTANIQMGSEAPDYGEMFGRIITQTGMRLQQVAARRPLKLKSMNDALNDLAAASRLMASRGEQGQILEFLELSRRHQPDNSFSWLLEGIWSNAHGQSAQADAAWERFLVLSRAYSELDKSFISWDDFHLLRKIVYELLRARGVSFQGRESDIQVRIPFSSLAQYIQHPAGGDRLLSMMFVGVLFGGLFVFAGALLAGISFQTPFLRQLMTFYGIFWFAYGLWFLDLVLELPFGWSRFQLVPGILGVSFFYAALQNLLRVIKHRRLSIAEGYEVCPHCKAVIPKLHLECPECRRSLQGD